MNEQRKWQAEWIWGSGETSPRNEWRCFRGQFMATAAQCGSASIAITADSRYVLFVNGKQVGRGPVRSWPFELAYDEYDIGHLLKPDQTNTVAVLALHFGVSTFYYLRGRGGLLAEVTAGTDSGRELLLATGSGWSTAVHEGHDTRSPRMSCQHAFSEVTDARLWDEAWAEPQFDASAWEEATAIGPAGMEPWTKLVAKTIPHLTEEPLYPVRVESLRRVEPIAWAAAFDLRNAFRPESASHANLVELSGYLSTVIRTVRGGKFTLGIPDAGRLFGAAGIGGVWFEKEAFRVIDDQYRLEVELPGGDHLLLLDVSGTTHGHAYHLAIDSEAPFELVSPLGEETATAFALVGPFAIRDIIDHQAAVPIDRATPAFERVRGAATAAELAQAAGEWLKPVDAAYISRDDVYARCVWTRHAESLPVPLGLQQAVIAGGNAATVPLFPIGDAELIVDFGRELSGFLTFEVDAAAGTVIDLYGFEYLREGWRQDTNGLDNTLRYICREGRQTYASPVRRGLRYAMVVVREAARPLRFIRLQLIQSNYPVADIGRFQCSDPILNDIWQISKHTTRVCMEDTFVDCPAYEQTFWVGDARNEALVNYYLFGDTAIVDRCLRLVPGSRFQSPLYVDQVPSGWNSVIPNWTFFWAIACLELYRYGGNREFADQMWPHVSFTLDHYLQKRDAYGLLNMPGWNLLDWAPIDQPREGTVTHQNMFLAKALRAADELASGRDGYDGRFAQAAEALRRSINARLWSEERQAYVDCIHADGRVSTVFSMQTQTVAYLCGIAEGGRLKRLERYLLQPPAEFVQIGSPFMSFFYHEALAKLGRFDALVDDIRVQYGQMIDNDATTCWEMYPGGDGGGKSAYMLTRSHCHAWSAGPGYFFGAYVLGVQGADPGWTKVKIEPQPAGLAWARGAVPHPGGGRIDVSWKLDPAGTRMHIRVEAPRGVELTVVAPANVEATVERHAVG